MNKILKISIWILTLGLGITLLGFANKEQNKKTCWNLDIKIHNNDLFQFISEKSIKQDIKNLGNSLVGSTMEQIDIGKITTFLLQISAVKDCNVYKTLDGQVKIEITQRTPIARIMNQDGSSYYLDDTGQIMSLSQTYTAKVPLVTGKINESPSLGSVKTILENENLTKSSILDNVFVVMQAIEKNEFMKSLTDYMYVDKNGDFVIIPRVGRQNIILGNNKNLEEKFINLKSFYLGTIGKINIDQYKTISVKFDEQVIGTKY